MSYCIKGFLDRVAACAGGCQAGGRHYSDGAVRVALHLIYLSTEYNTYCRIIIHRTSFLIQRTVGSWEFAIDAAARPQMKSKKFVTLAFTTSGS